MGHDGTYHIDPAAVDAIAERMDELRAENKRLRAACEDVLAIAENRRPGHWDDVMALMRAALAGEEQPDGS